MNAHSLSPPAARRVRAPWLWLAAAAVALVALLVRAHVNGEYDPAGEAYFANYPGELGSNLRMGAIELLVLVGLLRPWSYRHAVGRAAVALLLWLPWAALGLFACMHCGSLGSAHGLWRLIVLLGLFVAMIVSQIGGVRSRRAGADAAPGVS